MKLKSILISIVGFILVIIGAITISLVTTSTPQLVIGVITMTIGGTIVAIGSIADSFMW